MNKIDVVCGVLIKNDKYLITQKGGGKDHSLWEFPGGKVNPNETCFEAIYREIKEELGISIVPKNEIMRYEFDIYNLIFIECLPKNKTTNVKLNVHLDYKWVTPIQINDFDFVGGDLKFINAIF
jgi:8-oxo-dGTP diphosphatase|tara:strand:- start:785 stop:1156 length:372 start_codon:yes stop_codon:yes gene_type:complete